MTPRPTALALALTGAASLSHPAIASDRLTIYSGDFESVAAQEGRAGGPGFALVERRVGFDLKAGDNDVSLAGMPRAMDASSVVLKPLGGAQVRGQRFDFAVAGQDELLRRAIGQQVTVEQSVGSDRQSFSGTLISTGNGLTLRLADGRIRVLSTYSSFELPRLPAGVVNEPTLAWQIAADRAGRQDFGLNYASAGLAWRAEYRIDASGQGKACKMSLDGAAMVANRSGADFKDVMLTLVAGEPRRAQAMAQPEMYARDKVGVMAMAAPAPPQAEASGEYQAYKLPNPSNLPQGSVQRLALVDTVSGIECERRYESRYDTGDWRPAFPIIDENFGAGDGQQQAVVATLRFNNGKAKGLGIPLPAGRVRMFEGSDFLGEASLGHTAAGQDVALEIGNVFDLRAERTRESFKLDRAGRTITETISLRLTNAKSAPVTVRVQERLGRWTDWEMVSSSEPFEKRNASAVSFDVPVPAGGETKFSYTVRYRWAADVKLPGE